MRRVARIDQTRNGCGPDARGKPEQRLDPRLRSRRDNQRDPIARDRLRRSDAEHGIGCRPRRQAVDLGADHAVEEVSCGLWKVDRAEQHLVRPHDHFDAAAPQCRLPFTAERRLGPAVRQAKGKLRQHRALARRDDARGEIARLALDKKDPPPRRESGHDRLHRGGNGGYPDCE